LVAVLKSYYIAALVKDFHETVPPGIENGLGVMISRETNC
jgi:hypothetical protein